MKRFLISRHAVAASLLCLALALPLGGCGAAGMPQPKKTQDTFTITGQTLFFMGDCLVANGTVNGAINNMESITLELAPVDAYGDCPGCPFVPREYGEFTARDAQLDADTGQFMFSFCPADTASMYRWRLVGKNVFPGLPGVTTTPRVISLE